MTTPEKSVDEIVEVFDQFINYFGSKDRQAIRPEFQENPQAIKNWLTQTLQAERQKREEMVETVRKEEAQRIMDWLYERQLPIPLYIVERLGGLTQPNNPTTPCQLNK